GHAVDPAGQKPVRQTRQNVLLMNERGNMLPARSHQDRERKISPHADDGARPTPPKQGPGLPATFQELEGKSNHPPRKGTGKSLTGYFLDGVSLTLQERTPHVSAAHDKYYFPGRSRFAQGLGQSHTRVEVSARPAGHD